MASQAASFTTICTWGPTQVPNYRASIQVGCLTFTWALYLLRHVSRLRLFKNRTGSPVLQKLERRLQHRTANWERGFHLWGGPLK